MIRPPASAREPVPMREPFRPRNPLSRDKSERRESPMGRARSSYTACPQRRCYMTKIGKITMLSLLALAAGACSGDPATLSGGDEASAHATHLANQPEGSLLAEVRRATARYHDIDAA